MSRPALSNDSSILSLPLLPSTTNSTLSPIDSTPRKGNILPTPRKERVSSPRTHLSEDDMTEDEVALMVKNALRKARRAMSSPSESDGAFKCDSLSNGGSKSSMESFDGSKSTSSLGTPAEVASEEDLARRIEEEIKGARAFAEKVYYGGRATARSTSGSLGSGEVKEMTVDHLSGNIVPDEGSKFYNLGDDNHKSLSMSGSGSLANPVQNNFPLTAGAKKVASSNNINTVPPSLRVGVEAEGDSQPIETVHSQNLNPPTHTIPKREPPRQHRQVVFRHPYPLPPPPILPRPDATIISENDVPPKALSYKISEPDSDLLALIHAATDESLVRRSNACGALKVLASKDNNRAKMCRTRGLLEALLTASKDDAVDSDALDARTRAVTTLLYLSEPKDNRLLVCRHLHMLEILVKVIDEDTGEARLRACCCLATLAKTPQNRSLICDTAKLPGVLSGLLAENAVVKKEDEDKFELKRVDTVESRDDSSMRGEDAMTASFNSEDDRMLSNTYSGTFSHGTGTFTDDQYYSEDDEEDGSYNSQEEDEDGYSSGGYSEVESVQEEEGVEMQISSLKKLNIENHQNFLARSQLSACATLTHLTKHCPNAVSTSLEMIIFCHGSSSFIFITPPSLFTTPASSSS